MAVSSNELSTINPVVIVMSVIILLEKELPITLTLFLETEYHYLLICPKCHNLRTKYIKKLLLYMAYPTQTNTTSIISIEYNCSNIYRKIYSLPIKLEMKH